MGHKSIPNVLGYPIFFKPNRVWRLYKGGAVLDKISTGKIGADGVFPEEWIASTTVAENGDNQQSEYEGLSVVEDGTPEGVLLTKLIEKFPAEILGTTDYDEDGLGILCKFIDSAIRLPIQCHPDVEFAKIHCGSNHGKTEMWIVLATRQINGVEPYVYIGFKPGISPEKFKKAVYEQDIDFITSSMHRYEVKESQMYFIPGRLPHAIGSGVVILEVQEPTDLVVQPEKWLDDVELSDEDMWKGLEPEVGLECFDYDNVFDRAETLNRYSLSAKITAKNNDLEHYDIVNRNTTRYFKVQRIDVKRQCLFKPDMSWYIGVVGSGSGKITYADRSFNVKKGSYFLVPAALDKIGYIPQENMTVYLISK